MQSIIIDHGNISEEKQVFRKNRSTIVALFIVREIVEKFIEYTKRAFMCFIDLTEAFARLRLYDIL